MSSTTRRTLPAFMLLGASLLSAHISAAELSGNVSFTTDYKFRGISQNDTAPAIQGGLDLNFDSGFYAGVWGSMVDFDDPDSSDARLEVDYYVGYSGNINEDLSYDIGYIYYDYPGSDETTFALTGKRDLDYQEVALSLSWKDLTVGVNYSDDYWLETGKFFYLYSDYSFSLPEGFSLDLHVGLNKFEFEDDDSNPKDAEHAFLTDGKDSYTDYSITLSKSWQGLDFGLSLVDTNLDEDECAGTDWCDSSVIFSISKSF